LLEAAGPALGAAGMDGRSGIGGISGMPGISGISGMSYIIGGIWRMRAQPGPMLPQRGCMPWRP
jgi:hypothetical protein